MGTSGPILDVHVAMHHVTVAIADYSGPKGGDPETNPERKIPLRRENSPRHVLVVDDEPLIRWSVSESLSELGFDVEQAGDAATALRIATSARLPFDVVVLDLRLPDMDDLSLLGTLCQLMPDAQMILMTAFGTPEVIADAQAMGASVINKPFELDELKRLINP